MPASLLKWAQSLGPTWWNQGIVFLQVVLWLINNIVPKLINKVNSIKQMQQRTVSLKIISKIIKPLQDKENEERNKTDNITLKS